MLTDRRAPSAALVCLQCGLPARRRGTTICARCGLPYGEPPRDDAELASCPVCYASTDPDGRFASKDRPGRRLDMPDHIAEHDRHPVGDDEWLESFRRGDKIEIGRWIAPYDLVRRYLVTGVVDAGRMRSARHGTIITAMTQLARWGPDGTPVIGDNAEWEAARDAVEVVMARYHRGRL